MGMAPPDPVKHGHRHGTGTYSYTHARARSLHTVILRKRPEAARGLRHPAHGDTHVVLALSRLLSRGSAAYPQRAHGSTFTMPTQACKSGPIHHCAPSRGHASARRRPPHAVASPRTCIWPRRCSAPSAPPSNQLIWASHLRAERSEPLLGIVMRMCREPPRLRDLAADWCGGEREGGELTPMVVDLPHADSLRKVGGRPTDRAQVAPRVRVNLLVDAHLGLGSVSAGVSVTRRVHLAVDSRPFRRRQGARRKGSGWA